jgi:uncharacterized protein (DUF305 family)
MTRLDPTSFARSTAALVTSFLLVGCASSSDVGSEGPTPSDALSADGSASAPTVVQPGAPGEASRIVTAESVADRGLPTWTEADAEFMAGMIHHHAQALQMTALIPGRSASAGVRQMGLRMEISQRDEIRLMQDWLDERGLEYADVVLEKGPMQGTMGHDMAAMGGNAMDGGLMAMPGMLSPDQMEALRTAEGDTFDQFFLEYMIQHHTGALVMVEALFDTPGAGQDSKVFQFATDVDADQRAEMDRMRMLLAQYR